MHPSSIDGMLQTAIIAGAHGVISDLLAQVPVAFERAIICPPGAKASGYTVHADSRATSFSTATISTELRNADGQVQAQISNMRLTMYQGSAGNETVDERHPMLRICWKPDLATLQMASDALEAFIQREAAIERSSVEASTMSSLHEISVVIQLLCHKNPRTKILYLLPDTQDLQPVENLLTKLGSGIGFHSYSSFIIGKLTVDGVVGRKQLFDASSLEQLESLPDRNSETNFDAIVVPEALKEKQQLGCLLPFLSNNGLLLNPNTSGRLSSMLQQRATEPKSWKASSLCGIELVRRSQNVAAEKIDSLVIVEDESSSALSNALFKGVSDLTKAITRLSIKEVSRSSIPKNCTVVATIEVREPFLSIMDEAQMNQLKAITDQASNIVWITSSGLLNGDMPDTALVRGLSRSLMLEQPALSFYTLDIDSKTPYMMTADHVATILSQASISSVLDYEFVDNNQILQISRFVPDKISNEKFQQRQGRRSTGRALEKAGGCVLHLQSARQLDSICFKQELGSTKLQKDFVEIEVMSQGIGAKESKMLLGNAETTYSTCATEFTGIVRAVGSAVSNLVVRDRVAVMAPNHFRFVEQVHFWACQKLQPQESFTSLSIVLVAYATALYALHDRAHIQFGETVLVQIDSSGIGLAAARVADVVGAEIFCMVSTTQSREFLIEALGFDPSHVIVLDEASYLADVLLATHGRGVDIVLNSLSGDLLHDSWRACADFGRFVEIGNRNAGNLDMHFFSKQLTFTAFELENLFYSEDIKVQLKWSSLMMDALDLYRGNHMQTMEPVKTFEVSKLADAYRYVSAENIISKVAVSLENRKAKIKVLPSKYTTCFSPEKAYFLVGCLGGLGSSLAKWMVSRGAKRFFFLGRSGSDRPAARRLVEDLESAGAEVSVIRGDVSNTSDVHRAIDSIEGTIGGVVQAAMGLSEALFTTMTNSAWHTGVGPKFQGTWNIHNAIAKREAAGGLEFFLMTSSVSGSVGTATESNYCAANHFLDAFARYRHARNQPATALGLGMISEVGYLHENPEVEELLLRKGIQGINEDELLQIVDIALSSPAETPEFLRTDPLAYSHILTGLEPLALKELRRKGFNTSNPILSDPRASLLATAIDDLEGSDSSLDSAATISVEFTHAMEAAGENAPLRDIILTLVAKRFCNMMLIPAESLDVDLPLSTYGMDSMLAAEFRMWVYKTFKVDIPFLDLLSHTMTLDSPIDRIERDVTALLASG